MVFLSLTFFLTKSEERSRTHNPFRNSETGHGVARKTRMNKKIPESRFFYVERTGVVSMCEHLVEKEFLATNDHDSQ